MTTRREIPELEGYVTISLAAEMMGVTRGWAHQMARDGTLATARVIRSVGSQAPVIVREDEVLEIAARGARTVDALPA